MENTMELAIRTDIHFKSPDLEKATQEILAEQVKAKSSIEDCQKAIDDFKRKCAVIFRRVEEKKSWKVDGFKSLAEYAEAINFPWGKSMAHKFENAGRLMESKDKTVSEFAESTNITNLTELASADPKAVAEAIKNGDLKPDMTVKEVKEWKKNNTESKPKIEKRMDYKGAIYTTNSKGIKAEPINYANALKDELPFISDYSWNFHKFNEVRVEVGVNLEKLLQGQLEMAWYVVTPVIKSNTTNAKPVMNAETIKQALASLPDEVRKAILASME